MGKHVSPGVVVTAAFSNFCLAKGVPQGSMLRPSRCVPNSIIVINLQSVTYFSCISWCDRILWYMLCWKLQIVQTIKKIFPICFIFIHFWPTKLEPTFDLVTLKSTCETDPSKVYNGQVANKQACCHGGLLQLLSVSCEANFEMGFKFHLKRPERVLKVHREYDSFPKPKNLHLA